MLISFQLLFLDFPSGLFPSGFRVKTLYAFLFSSLNSITRCYLVSTVDAIFINKHCVRSTRVRHNPHVAIRRRITNQYRSADGSSQVSSNGNEGVLMSFPCCTDVSVLGSGIMGHAPRLTATGSAEMKTADTLLLQVMSCDTASAVSDVGTSRHLAFRFFPFSYPVFILSVKVCVSLFLYVFLRFFLHLLPLFLTGENSTW